MGDNAGARTVRRRGDIQALRALAVGAVVAFHLRPEALPGGFMGVDIFFVISGFLITGIICRDLDAGRFTLRAFWFARARRILPAALVVIALTLLAGLAIRSGADQIGLVRQAIASTAFVANFHFGDSGFNYFAPASDFEPLLHMWSLAVEEQYYLVAPILLLLLPRRSRIPVLVTVTLASLAICLRPLPGVSIGDIFYQPYARAWQLGLGGLVALGMGAQAHAPRLAEGLAWPALAILVVVAAFPVEQLAPVMSFRPGPSAILACLAVAVILAVRNPVIERSRIVGLLRPLGDLSYAIYLVHWPVLALYRNATMTADIPGVMLVPLLALILVLAVVLHRFVERPFHRGGWCTPKRLAGGLATAAVTIAALGTANARAGQASLRGPMVRAESYNPLGAACNFKIAYEPLAACRSGPNPELLVWGDSIAMSSIPGVMATGIAFDQATKAFCTPIAGIAPTNARVFDAAWAKGCIRFNDSLLDHVAAMPDLHTVLIAGGFDGLLDPSRRMVDRSGKVVPVDPARTGRAMIATVRRLQAMRKRVAILAPLPRADFDAGMCNERRAAHRLVLRPHGCAIPLVETSASALRPQAFLKAVAAAAGVTILDSSDLTCRGGLCRTAVAGISLYHDNGHFSPMGARWAAHRLELGSALNGQPKARQNHE